VQSLDLAKNALAQERSRLKRQATLLDEVIAKLADHEVAVGVTAVGGGGAGRGGGGGSSSSSSSSSAGNETFVERSTQNEALHAELVKIKGALAAADTAKALAVAAAAGGSSSHAQVVESFMVVDALVGDEPALRPSELAFRRGQVGTVAWFRSHFSSQVLPKNPQPPPIACSRTTWCATSVICPYTGCCAQVYVRGRVAVLQSEMS
jgi:hypothetical protein